MSAPDTDFETIREWFETCRDRAQRAGKPESAALWADGLAHLLHQRDTLEGLIAALRRAVLALAFAAESSPAMQDDYQAVSDAIAKATGVTSCPPSTSPYALPWLPD